jgi:hypothetical protein
MGDSQSKKSETISKATMTQSFLQPIWGFLGCVLPWTPSVAKHCEMICSSVLVLYLASSVPFQSQISKPFLSLASFGTQVLGPVKGRAHLA